MELTTTSYAMLGLLALQPWTTYELAQQVQRSLRNLWPMAERQLYEQPKTLVAHGLATSRKERTGDRPRTVYRITPKGRRALAAWIAEPGGDLVIRSELLLRSFFAERSVEPKATLLAHIDALRAVVAAAHDGEVARYEATRDEGYRFPDRRHVSALVASFYLALAEAAEHWAAWAAAEVDGWSDDLQPPPHADDLLASIYTRPTAPGR